jgi:hypothetical protein
MDNNKMKEVAKVAGVVALNTCTAIAGIAGTVYLESKLAKKFEERKLKKEIEKETKKQEEDKENEKE